MKIELKKYSSIVILFFSIATIPGNFEFFQWSSAIEEKVPSFIKSTANWWSEELVSDQEFIDALKFLI